MCSRELQSCHQLALLDVAREAIGYGLSSRQQLIVDESPYPDLLRRPGASFVTLKYGDKLRGCVGSLEPYRSLVSDVAGNAFAAAFADPRFPPLKRRQHAQLSISISVLSPAEELEFTDESDLIAQLRPGLDGVILQAETERATFLPAMWEALPDKQSFLANLKSKLGVPADYWSSGMRAWRYSVQTIC